MKSTRVFKILSIALAASVVFYFLVQGVRYLTNPYATTRVYTSTTGGGGEGGPGPGHRRHL